MKATVERAVAAGANLSSADLRSADLRSADLRYANLSSADLRSANLGGADLRSADLRSADLRSADLRSANPLILARLSIVPEVGSFTAWKKCRNGVIVKMLIPEKARRSNAHGRKCRAEFVKVLEVIGAEKGISDYDESVIYQEGKTVTCHQWNEDRWTECGGGIHFFITRIEAENYNL